MRERYFCTYLEAAERLGIDAETFRQTLLLGNGPEVYLEIDCWDARYEGSCPAGLVEGSNLHSQWEELAHVPPGEPPQWVLQGWFRVLPSSLKDALRARGFAVGPSGYYMPDVDVLPWQPLDLGGSQSCDEQLGGFQLPVEGLVPKYSRLEDLWFEVAEITKLLDSARPSLGPEKPLDPRERTTLLNIIGALAAEAKLDLTEPMKAGGAISTMLARRGITVGARAIGEHLKGVNEAMGSRKVK